MKKYVVKNCPAYINKPLFNHHEVCLLQNELRTEKHKGLYVHCKDIDNCLIKQVIRKCKIYTKDDICLECKCFENVKDYYECDYETHKIEIEEGRANVSFAQEILGLFEVEE